MKALAILLAVPLAGVALWLFLRRRRRQRRAALRDRPFPEPWRRILETSVGLYRHLPPDLRDRLHGHVQVFLDEKTFSGAQGLEITDEIRLVIAAEACILLLNTEAPTYFPDLRSIVVYPSAYTAPEEARDATGVVTTGPSARAGESWTRGGLAVAWDHAKGEARHLGSHHNVVLHEFAHQLDQEDGAADGVPILRKRAMYGPWIRILGGEFRELREHVARHRHTFLDDYGATNAAEFFAVASETFFERPHELRAREPELYDELREYYALDPAAWQQ